MKMEKFTSRYGRTIDKETLVGVHWNAHKKVWSIVEMKSRKTVGLVRGYASQVTLRDVTTHIDKSKQRMVVKYGTKDRHAFLVGYIEDLEFESLEKNIYYNPKMVKNFVDAQEFMSNLKQLKTCEVPHIEHVSRASLDFDFNKNRPVVTYSA